MLVMLLSSRDLPGVRARLNNHPEEVSGHVNGTRSMYVFENHVRNLQMLSSMSAIRSASSAGSRAAWRATTSCTCSRGGPARSFRPRSGRTTRTSEAQNHTISIKNHTISIKNHTNMILLCMYVRLLFQCSTYPFHNTNHHPPERNHDPQQTQACPTTPQP